MIARIHRFHGHNSLNHVYRHGQTVRAAMLTLKYADSRRPAYRLAVVVSKKVSKSAVVRNRIRRRIYEQVRTAFKEAPPSHPVDMVITVFDESFKSMPAENLQAAVMSLLKKTAP